VRRHCKEGLHLCREFARVLKVWGFEEADKQAAQMIPLGPTKLREISGKAKEAESALFQFRHAFVEHMAHCIVCSRHLVGD
jgi:hypothetical protein